MIQSVFNYSYVRMGCMKTFLVVLLSWTNPLLVYTYPVKYAATSKFKNWTSNFFKLSTFLLKDHLWLRNLNCIQRCYIFWYMVVHKLVERWQHVIVKASEWERLYWNKRRLQRRRAKIRTRNKIKFFPTPVLHE